MRAGACQCVHSCCNIDSNLSVSKYNSNSCLDSFSVLPTLNIVQILFKYCSKIVHKLFKKCSKNVQKMFKNCSNIVQIMFKYCSKIVQKLFKYWSNTDQILFKYHLDARASNDWKLFLSCLTLHMHLHVKIWKVNIYVISYKSWIHSLNWITSITVAFVLIQMR